MPWRRRTRDSIVRAQISGGTQNPRGPSGPETRPDSPHRDLPRGAGSAPGCGEDTVLLQVDHEIPRHGGALRAHRTAIVPVGPAQGRRRHGRLRAQSAGQRRPCPPRSPASSSSSACARPGHMCGPSAKPPKTWHGPCTTQRYAVVDGSEKRREAKEGPARGRLARHQPGTAVRAGSPEGQRTVTSPVGTTVGTTERACEGPVGEPFSGTPRPPRQCSRLPSQIGLVRATIGPGMPDAPPSAAGWRTSART